MNKSLAYIKSLINSETKIGIGVSWWPDSMALFQILLNFFSENNFPQDNIYVIYCDHNLRDKNETKQEYQLITNLDKTQGVNCFHETINPEKSRNEASLRQQRYEVFEQYISKYKLKYFFLGHNLTDRIESSFMHMLRGCDLKGFLAMQKQSSHHLLSCQVLRPLLDFTKKEIQNYCDENKIPYVIDQTNNDSEVSLRNKLRNEIFPQINQLANKSTTETSTFFESLKNIYTSLDTQQPSNSNNSNPWWINPWKIHLKSIYKPSQRQANFAYQVLLNLPEITESEVLQLFTQLNISNNITKNTLKERTNFIRAWKNSHKYFNNTYFFITNHELFVIQAPKDFRKTTNKDDKKEKKKNLDNTQLITTLGTYHLDTQTLEIKDKKYLNCTIWYYYNLTEITEKPVKFKGKNRNKYCINNKIPIFYRNHIPLIYNYNTATNSYDIKNYFYPFKTL